MKQVDKHIAFASIGLALLVLIIGAIRVFG